MKRCTSCGSEHIGLNPCGLTFVERLRSQTLDPSWMPTKQLKNYYDQEAIDADFGADAEELMMDETEGVGAYTREDMANYPGVESFYTEHGGDRTPIVDEA